MEISQAHSELFKQIEQRKRERNRKMDLEKTKSENNSEETDCGKSVALHIYSPRRRTIDIRQ